MKRRPIDLEVNATDLVKRVFGYEFDRPRHFDNLAFVLFHGSRRIVCELGVPLSNVEAEIVETGPDPAVVISAQQLANEYAADGKSATAKLDDKWAHVEGEVVEKTTSNDCAVLLRLKGENDVAVSCCFGDRNKRPVEALKVGTKVKVFGQLSLWKEKEVFLNSSILSEPR